jgi:hypothetical protein
MIPVLASLFDSVGKRDNIFLVFLGFAIGWISATIALRFTRPGELPAGCR